MTKTLTKQELANNIWAIANKLRTKIKINEYKDYILGFTFYKFLSDTEEEFLKKKNLSAKDLIKTDIVSTVQNELGYYIAYEDLFSTWVNMKIDLDSSRVLKALIRFNDQIKPDYAKLYKNIFSTLSDGLYKFGENMGGRDEAIRNIVAMIGKIPATSNKYDVIGYIYEFLTSKFATVAKDDGAFYTPHEVSELISMIVVNDLSKSGKDSVRVYDPTCGSAGLLLTISDAIVKIGVKKDRIEYFGQEIITETYNLLRMNLAMKGLKPAQINVRNGDTLKADWPYFDEYTAYQPMFVDIVISNPPFSLRWDVEGMKNDERFRDYVFSLKDTADYAFLLHGLYHLKPDGIMGIVLPHGVLFRGGTEKAIRKQLVENNQIETIIGLSEKLFYNTSVPTIIMILRKTRTYDDSVLFIDASREFKHVRRQNVLTDKNIKKIYDAVVARKDIDKFAHLATKDEIVDQQYNLNIPRYVDATEVETEIPIDSIRSEIAQIKADEKAAIMNINTMMEELGLGGI